MSKLEKLGIVERRLEDGNKRKQHVYLTGKGKELQSVLEPLAVEANQAALRGLSNEDQTRLHQVLIQILGNLAEDEAEAEALGIKVPPTRGAAI